MPKIIKLGMHFVKCHSDFDNHHQHRMGFKTPSYVGFMKRVTKKANRLFDSLFKFYSVIKIKPFVLPVCWPAHA